MKCYLSHATYVKRMENGVEERNDNRKVNAKRKVWFLALEYHIHNNDANTWDVSLFYKYIVPEKSFHEFQTIKYLFEHRFKGVQRSIHKANKTFSEASIFGQLSVLHFSIEQCFVSTLEPEFGKKRIKSDASNDVAKAGKRC